MKLCIGNFTAKEIAWQIQMATKGAKIHFISDSNVAPLYLNSLLSEMKNLSVTVSVVQAGEQSKNITTLETLLEKMVSVSLTRSDAIVYLGGGVVGDLAGFAAAVYLRGIRYIALPTTLLAMCDSALGGKCGIDLKCGKNLAGAFYQPQAVIANTGYLKTLPEREFSCGLAEVIKYGFIKDVEILQKLEKENAKDIAEELVRRSAQIKLDITARDFTDKGERMLLNFGHTLAHAVETLGDYRRHSHGEAVAVGMNFAAYVSYRLGGADVRERMRKICQKYFLPTTCGYETNDLVDIIKHDKKNIDGSFNFAVLKKAGEAYLYRCDVQTIKNYLDEWRRDENEYLGN